MKTESIVILLCLCSALTAGEDRDDARGVRYLLVDLGTLGGAGESSASAVNDNGQVVGRSGQRAFLWDRDLGMIDLGTLGGSFSQARDVNEKGQVVGDSSTRAGERRAFLWEDLDGDGRSDVGEMRELPPLDGYSTSSGFAINRAGVAVGHSSGSSLLDPRRATLWEPGGEVRDLGTLEESSVAFDVNDLGVVVGHAHGASRLRAWIWDAKGGMRRLQNLVGGPSSSARGINDRGQVVGQSNDIAFVWEEGQSFHLHGVLPAGEVGDEAVAQAVNVSGRVVGDINYESEPDGRERGGFLWDEANGLILIDALLPDGLGQVESAADINSHGEIVGAYRNAGQGRRRAFLLSEDTDGSEPFVRGDANGDGKVNVSDGIATLSWLFAGDFELGCTDAADMNDSGKVDISDAIAVLGYLFLGMSPPPFPGPSDCGPDPTHDGLNCASGNCP